MDVSAKHVPGISPVAASHHTQVYDTPHSVCSAIVQLTAATVQKLKHLTMPRERAYTLTLTLRADAAATTVQLAHGHGSVIFPTQPAPAAILAIANRN